tara:strand:+ start:243 stop:587 length:345 start_codon:yes stop_codon:yes gene_type:complete
VTYFKLVADNEWEVTNDKGTSIALIKQEGCAFIQWPQPMDGLMLLSTIELVAEGSRLIADRHFLAVKDGVQRSFKLEYDRIKVRRRLMEYIERGSEEELSAYVDGVRTTMGRNN